LERLPWIGLESRDPGPDYISGGWGLMESALVIPGKMVKRSRGWLRCRLVVGGSSLGSLLNKGSRTLFQGSS